MIFLKDIKRTIYIFIAIFFLITNSCNIKQPADAYVFKQKFSGKKLFFSKMTILNRDKTYENKNVKAVFLYNNDSISINSKTVSKIDFHFLSYILSVKDYRMIDTGLTFNIKNDSNIFSVFIREDTNEVIIFYKKPLNREIKSTDKIGKIKIIFRK